MIYYSSMKTPNSYIKTIRYAVQGVFLLLTLFIGFRFYDFVMQFAGPGHPLVQRPPSIEAFLPIAGLMSFKFFLFTFILYPSDRGADVVQIFSLYGYCRAGPSRGIHHVRRRGNDLPGDEKRLLRVDLPRRNGVAVFLD